MQAFMRRLKRTQLEKSSPVSFDYTVSYLPPPDAQGIGEWPGDKVNAIPATRPHAGVQVGHIETEPRPVDTVQPPDIDADNSRAGPKPGDSNSHSRTA